MNSRSIAQILKVMAWVQGRTKALKGENRVMEHYIRELNQNVHKAILCLKHMYDNRKSLESISKRKK